jgi:hypothetical protein
LAATPKLQTKNGGNNPNPSTIHPNEKSSKKYNAR